MALVPLDKSNEVSIYSNNSISTVTDSMLSVYTPRTDCPVDPRNDLLPPGFSSPFNNMKYGPPEQTIQRYYSITVNDIENFHKNKIKKWIKIYEKVLGNCFRKIREYVLRDQKYCIYSIPEYITGFPLYNITHCTCFVIKKLASAGFTTKYIPPNNIYIYWNVRNQKERIYSTSDYKKINYEPVPTKKTNNNLKTVHIKPQVNYNSFNIKKPSENIYDKQIRRPPAKNNYYGMQKEEQFLFT